MRISTKTMSTTTLTLALLLLAVAITAHLENDISTMSILRGNGKIHIGDDLITMWMKKPKGEFIEKRIRLQGSNHGVPLITNDHNYFSATWQEGQQLSIKSNIGEDTSSFHTEITGTLVTGGLEACLDLGTYNWYGGAETYTQAWPIQNQDISKVAFVPNGQNGGVLDRYFLSSFGYSTYYNSSAPLFVALDSVNKTLCFTNEYVEPYRNTEGRPLAMNSYDVVGQNLLDVYKYGRQSYFVFPAGIPSEKVFRDPIWSTWAIYKSAINQSIVLDFAQQVDDNGFPSSQIEIDDNWETCYGNEVFNPTTFPDPADMVANLKANGHDVTLWVHPFVNTNCELFAEGDANKYFVTVNGTNVTGMTSWWDGSEAGIIDITNSAAADWWYQRLDGLRTNVGITAFKFDAGESHWLPQNAYLNSTEDEQPGIYSTEYARFANRFGGQVEARVGFRSQDTAIFIRELDRDSTWGLDNGLQSIITSALHMGLMGSAFVLPDYIGGNAYGTEYPLRDLFVRWVEVNAFLPVMQFSITPWDYDDEVVQICRNMVALHQNISDVIIAAANQATVDGSPIIRPLWWADPLDVQAQVIRDEFLVGDAFLVAPIVTPLTISRDIYLPAGNWVDKLRGGTYAGPAWLTNYSVSLNEIAYFAAA